MEAFLDAGIIQRYYSRNIKPFFAETFMDCPVCKNAMITLELQDVEVDHCTICGGIWLDAGELEVLLGNSGGAVELLKSFEIDSKCTERARKCPICLKRMRKIIVGKAHPPVLIDKCAKGDGLWFDKNELQNIFDNADLDKDSKIKKFLADIFVGK
jgi:Zn-finger nucleic acid-binding protein